MLYGNIADAKIITECQRSKSGAGTELVRPCVRLSEC